MNESASEAVAAQTAAHPDTIPVSGPRIPRREVWADLPEGAYPGFKVRLWVNYPRRLEADLTSGDQARVTEALNQIVIEHNGWLDDEGTPLPPANTSAFWEAVPGELGFAISTTVGIETRRLAADMASQPGTPGRGR